MPPPAPIPLSPGASVRVTTHSNAICSDYDLIVRQQPKQARICNGHDKHPKGPVDPPPVVRLQISRVSQAARPLQLESDPSGRDKRSRSPTNRTPDKRSADVAGPNKFTSSSLIQSPYLFCFASLCRADLDEDLTVLQDGKTRYTTGNVVSSLYHLRDPEDGSSEGFFVFPDIGIRVEGRFRLRLSLFEMVDATVHLCKTVYTDVFDAFSHKRYPGLGDSTELSKSFASQGLKMRIKGGAARTMAKPVDPGASLVTPPEALKASTGKRPHPEESSQHAKRRRDESHASGHQPYVSQYQHHDAVHQDHRAYNIPPGAAYGFAERHREPPRYSLPPRAGAPTPHISYHMPTRGSQPDLPRSSAVGTAPMLRQVLIDHHPLHHQEHDWREPRYPPEEMHGAMPPPRPSLPAFPGPHSEQSIPSPYGHPAQSSRHSAPQRPPGQQHHAKEHERQPVTPGAFRSPSFSLASSSRLHRSLPGTGTRLPSLAEVMPHDEALFSPKPQSSELSADSVGRFEDAAADLSRTATRSLHSLLNPLDDQTARTRPLPE